MGIKSTGQALYRVGGKAFDFIDDAIDFARKRWEAAPNDALAKDEYLKIRKMRDDNPQPSVSRESTFVERQARADEQGYTPVVYHGSKRMDRLLEGDSLNSKRATSGPMPFFTDDPQIASNYSTSKADTSLGDNGDFSDWYKFKAGPGREKTLDSVWWHLKDDEKADIASNLGKITLDDDGVIVFGDGPGGKEHWDWALKEANGNPLRAAKDVWLNSGMIFGEEEKFIDVLRKAGLKSGVRWDAPHMEMPGVMPARLRMTNPLDTSNADTLKAVASHLEKAGKGKRYKQRGRGVDQWDKRSIGIKEFTDRLNDDIENGTYHAWTSIPDEVTAELKTLGYDGIVDQGGKGGGMGHSVFIPFNENQVRSVNADYDPTKRLTNNLLAGVGAAAVGIGAMAPEDAEAGVITRGGKRLIEAWHGSPHKFDKFSMDNIGTGEGAQAYGHGLYFADSEGVAKGYRDRLSPSAMDSIDLEALFYGVKEGPRITNTDEAAAYVSEYFNDAIKESIEQGRYALGGTEERALNSLRDAIIADKSALGDLSSISKGVDIADWQSVNKAENTFMQKMQTQIDEAMKGDGALYRTEIDVDPGTLLDWDKPLSEQSEAARTAIQGFIDDGTIQAQTVTLSDGTAAYRKPEDMDGAGLLEALESGLSRLGNPNPKATVSQWLLNDGVPGIRYADGMSRNKAGEKTYNYVMFDDKPINIVERGNADPALLAATAAGVAGGTAASRFAFYEDDPEIDQMIGNRLSVRDFRDRRSKKKAFWDKRRAELLSAVSDGADNILKALEKPMQGYHGMTAVAGSLAAGNDLETALMRGGDVARQPIADTAQQLGDATFEATGSPLLSTAVYTGANIADVY